MTKKLSRRAIIPIAGLLALLLLSPQVILRAVYPRKYSDTVESCALTYDVPPQIIYAVIKTESNFRPDVVSSAGAVGLMQIMPSTFFWLADLMGEEHPISALTDPAINIKYGTFFLRYLYDYYGDYETAFAAYNAGMGNVSKWLESEEHSHNGKLTSIPFSETAAYVRSVTDRARQYQKLYKMKG